MKKVSPNTPDQKKKIPYVVLTVCLCLLFFAAGVSVPMLVNSHNGSTAELSKFDSVLKILKNNWYFGQSEDKDELETRLVENAITGMTTLEEDPHTNYFNLEQAKAFSQSLAGSNVGIGVMFFPNSDGYMQVSRIFTNSTADSAGLQKGDIITQVGDKPTNSTPTEDLVSYIKSQDGKELQLTVLRDGNEQIVTVIPGEYDSTVSEEINDDYGEIILTSFSENSGEEFTEAVGRMQKAGVKNLIIDLRGNTGGYLSAAEQIASSLLPEDTVIFQEKDADGSTKSTKTLENYGQIDFDKIIILQDGDTASASEVLIGALKDNLPEDKLVTIGTNTYGKGTEQRSYLFKDGTSMKYTVAEWLTPNGTSVNEVGFEPDYEVEPASIRTVAYAAMEDDEVIEPDTVALNAQPAQMFLTFLGYDADRSDPYFSQKSSEALKQYQRDKGLDATGKIDKTTFEKLLEDVTVKLNEDDQELDTIRNKAISLITGKETGTTTQGGTTDLIEDTQDAELESIDGPVTLPDAIPIEDAQN